MLRPLAIVLALVFLGAFPFAAQDHTRRASPFQELRWVADAPEVRVDADWYRPIAIDGLAVEEILAFCETRWPGRKEKRFAEDLVEAMHLMGQTPGAASPCTAAG